jgi:hypothetical protein
MPKVAGQDYEIRLTQDGNSRTGKVYFEVLTDMDLATLSEHQAQIQKAAGYDECGYGGSNAYSLGTRDGKNVYIWFCWANCD